MQNEKCKGPVTKSGEITIMPTRRVVKSMSSRRGVGPSAQAGEGAAPAPAKACRTPTRSLRAAENKQTPAPLCGNE